MAFYGVFTPSKVAPEPNADDESSVNVFTEKNEALKVLKALKDSRLKVFNNKDDAVTYANLGYEVTQTKYEDLKSPTLTEKEKTVFRAPTKQELTKFRKLIEENNLEMIKQTIWKNPRYLVSSGDTPTSLKEGFRYNALHICATEKKPLVADLILKTISDLKFFELLHGMQDQQFCETASEMLLDYYLNIPEKGRNETPLHMASKVGAAEVIEVLTSYKQCKMTVNSEKKLPKDIICSRMNDPPQELIERIAGLLEGRFYVPVIRSLDNSLPPIIGEPFSPAHIPELNVDPLSPEVEIQAVAGPMTKEQAQNFRRRWKTPPRVQSPLSTSFTGASNQYSSPMKFNQMNSSPLKSPVPTMTINNNVNNNIIISSSTPKAANKITRRRLIELVEDTKNGNSHDSEPNLPIINKLQAKPPPTFLTPLRKNPLKKDLFFTYRDVRVADSPCPFDMNETVDSVTNLSMEIEVGGDHNNSMNQHNTSLKERHVKNMDVEKGLEVIGRELAKEQNVEWREYWDFLGDFIDIASDEGLQRFETYLATRVGDIQPDLMTNLCSALNKIELSTELIEKKLFSNLQSNGFKGREPEHSQSQQQNSSTPYQCIEKSLQVFATRMTKTILHNVDSVVSINDAFNSELKRLKSLICSFKADARFLNIIDFSFVHSRFANLIASNLKNTKDINATKLEKIENCFEQIIASRRKSSDKKEQLQCACEFIIRFLQSNDEKILPENMKTEKICLETWQSETKCECVWESGPNRQNSRKKRFDKNDDTNRRLFDTAVEALPTDNNINTNQWRQQNTSTDSEQSFSIVNGANNSDDDEYGSIVDSDEDDIFFTPPDTPTKLQFPELNEYTGYIFGNEPTKRDLDVLNAIFHLDIDRELYPKIHLWRVAVMNHPNEERDK
ncbi:ANKLE2 family protein [Megaselia abdita]